MSGLGFRTREFPVHPPSLITGITEGITEGITDGITEGDTEEVTEGIAEGLLKESMKSLHEALGFAHGPRKVQNAFGSIQHLGICAILWLCHCVRTT